MIMIIIINTVVVYNRLVACNTSKHRTGSFATCTEKYHPKKNCMYILRFAAVCRRATVGLKYIVFHMHFANYAVWAAGF